MTNTRKINMRLSADEHEYLLKLANDYNMTLSALLRLIIRSHVKDVDKIKV